MKKKIILLILLSICTLSLTGCFNNDELEGSDITTTVYPIEYLVTRLYNYNNKVSSIYPNDTDTFNYELTTKQLNDFSKKTNLFVYNGLSNEKEVARKLVDKNDDIQIVDASFGLSYTYGLEELWLSPNNYLMLANTIKDNLEELSASKYAAEKIEENYKVLEEELSILDATIRNIGKTAKKNGTNNVVIAYDSFGFLEEYGFNVINISTENKVTTNIKNKFKNKTYKYVFVKDIKNVDDYIKDIVDNYGVTLVEINTLDTLTDEERTNNDNYLTIMNNFISDLSKVVLEKK